MVQKRVWFFSPTATNVDHHSVLLFCVCALLTYNGLAGQTLLSREPGVVSDKMQWDSGLCLYYRLWTS
jgi:hypothetical protein